MPRQCWNGPDCVYLARGTCLFQHPGRVHRCRVQEQRHMESLEVAFKRMVVSMLREEDMEKLFLLLEEGGEDVKEVEQEVLRRIRKSDEEQCLRVLHITVGRAEESFKHLEEKALEVMTRSYSYFSETLWTDFAVKQLSLVAFTKLAGAAKKAKLDWDKSDYSELGCLSDSESESSDCDLGQLSDPSMQEDFKALLAWVEREDVEKARKDLVLAVFKTKERSSKGLVLQWMRGKIAGWEKREREEEEEMERIEEEFRRNEAMGIPFSFDIPGAYGRRMDARFAEVKKLMAGGGSEERKMARFYQLMDEQEEDNDENMW